MAQINSVIDDKYEILKLIGQGGMSKVYLAMDKRLNKQWAVKEVEKNSQDANNSIIVQSVIAEANMMKKLDHPALPRIVDIIETPRLIYVVMDYVEGESLNKILEEYGAQSQDLVIDWAKQLCKVLDYLHTLNPPIIYRDMKPSNIILQPNGTIKLLDFGIAREYKTNSSADTVSLGTKGYAAPEQFGGNGQSDTRTDIYCLGVTLYHLITGQNPCDPPYELYPIRNWNPTLSGGVEKIILKCTQLNPADRYQNCTDLFYAFEHYEKIDDAFQVKQKKTLLLFFAIVATCLFFFGFGIFGRIVSANLTSADFNNTMQLAAKATDSEKKIEYYLRAIKIRPLAIEAYDGLIESFKNDANFSVEEAKKLEELVNLNFEELKKTPHYSSLAFEIGKLYWYYYEYGKSDVSDNQITRMKSSIQWFEDAVNYGTSDDVYYQMAVTYRDVGKFNRDITLNVEEASDKGEYIKYFENMKELLSIVNSDESEIVQLELYRLVIYSIETYSRKFKLDGVLKADVQKTFETVKTRLDAIEVTTEKTEMMKDDIVKRLVKAQKAIDTSFFEAE